MWKPEDGNKVLNEILLWKFTEISLQIYIEIS